MFYSDSAGAFGEMDCLRLSHKLQEMIKVLVSIVFSLLKQWFDFSWEY